MVLGKLPSWGRPTYLDDSMARAYCAFSRCGWGLFGHFFSVFSLWKTARYKLKYCLKGPLNPKQPTNLHLRLILMHSINITNTKTVSDSFAIFTCHLENFDKKLSSHQKSALITYANVGRAQMPPYILVIFFQTAKDLIRLHSLNLRRSRIFVNHSCA